MGKTRTLLALTLLLVSAPVARADGVLDLRVGAADIVKTTRGARTVVIGNPLVADATVVNENTIILTGKAEGATDVILLDEAGAEIIRREIHVGGRQLRVRLHQGNGEDVELLCTNSRCVAPPRGAGLAETTTMTTTKRKPSGEVETKEVTAASPGAQAAPAAPAVPVK